MAYDLFCNSIQGSGHIKNGIPREDYGIKKDAGICKVFALGDGHGDSNCPRSELGSRYVCEIAAEELAKFASDLSEHEWNGKLFNRTEADELILQLVTSIFGKWSCMVNDDYIQNPLTEKEEAGAAEYIEKYRRGERIEHIYGTTFIAGLLTDEYLLLLQQGDGRCVVFNQDGSASQPIPWDDRCFANVTTSVCDIDAVPSCRYHVVDLSQNRVIACVAGSDGVEDSFPSSMDKMHAYYRSILKIACESGVEALENHLNATLPSLSANGSTDDITICGIIDTELFAQKLEKMEVENEIVELKDKIALAQERIDSMTNKLSFLQKKYDSVMLEYNAVQVKYSELTAEYESINNDIASYKQGDGSETEKAAEETSDSGFFAAASAAFSEARRKLFSPFSLRCLQQRLEKIEKEKLAVQIEFEQITAKKSEFEADYIPYKEKFESFVAMKNDAQMRLDMING